MKTDNAKKLTVALIGNQNSGKTSLFNSLVGARQKVGNWPGVTIEKVAGTFHCNGVAITVIDLPGIYSIIPYTPEEKITLKYLLKEQPDLILNVIDANNLERNLYLTTQLLDTGLPMVGILSIFDETNANGISLDVELMSKLLGIKLFTISVKKNKGLDQICAMLAGTVDGFAVGPKIQHYEDIEDSLALLEKYLQKDLGLSGSSRWLAVKLLERDHEVTKKVMASPVWMELAPVLAKELQRLEVHYDQDLLSVFVESRYAFINGVILESVKMTPQARSFTQKLDDFLINRFIGLPIFFAVMWLLFQLTFTLGAVPIAWLETFFGCLGELAHYYLPAGPIRSLVSDGIIAGIGGVLTFVPNILILFFGISILEASGYISRAAFIVDKLMHRFGLHGKSFIPMLLGFGCTVPAYLACRTLKNKADRITTMLILPFISCSAKLPVYVLLVSAFFPKEYAGTVFFGIYMFGVLTALLMARMLKKVLFKGEAEPFVMELPPYRLPSLKNILIHTWEKTVMYLRKAGTVLLGFAIVIWFLTTYPTNQLFVTPSEKLAGSYAGRFGQIIEPALKPLGFNWEVGVALISGFAAKEVVVSTLTTIYARGADQDSFIDIFRQRSGLTPLNALTLMIFVLLYVPCAAATTIFHKEAGSWYWTGFFLFFTTGTAYLMSFIVYQGGRLLGF